MEEILDKDLTPEVALQSNLTGTILLSFMTLLERAGFYGVRAIIVLYAIDESGLNMEESKSLELYGILTSLIVFLPIPLSYLTDKFLGQTRSIYLGGLVTSMGYMLLMVNNTTIFYTSFVIIAVGISLVKPSTTILVGRQFIKQDRNRTLAYIIFFFGINLGAFLGAIAIAYAGEIYGWEWGFLLAATCTILYLVVFKLFGSSIVQRESNTLMDSETTLDFKKMLPVLTIFILLYIVFSKCSEASLVSYIVEITDSDDNTFLGFELFESIIQSITTIWSVPLTLAIYIYWKIKGVGKTLNLVGASFMILIVSILLTALPYKIRPEFVLDYAILPFGMFALAEAVIVPLITSYVTRISDVNYSNTIYSLFVFLTYFLGAGLIILNDYQTILVLIILAITLSLLFIFRNEIIKLTYGIE